MNIAALHYSVEKITVQVMNNPLEIKNTVDITLVGKYYQQKIEKKPLNCFNLQTLCTHFYVVFE